MIAFVLLAAQSVFDVRVDFDIALNNHALSILESGDSVGRPSRAWRVAKRYGEAEALHRVLGCVSIADPPITSGLGTSLLQQGLLPTSGFARRTSTMIKWVDGLRSDYCLKEWPEQERVLIRKKAELEASLCSVNWSSIKTALGKHWPMIPSSISRIDVFIIMDSILADSGAYCFGCALDQPAPQYFIVLDVSKYDVEELIELILHEYVHIAEWTGGISAIAEARDSLRDRPVVYVESVVHDYIIALGQVMMSRIVGQTYQSLYQRSGAHSLPDGVYLWEGVLAGQCTIGEVLEAFDSEEYVARNLASFLTDR